MLVAFAVPVAVVELASWAYVRWERPDLRSPWPGDNPQIIESDPDYGWRLPRSQTLHAVKHTPEGGICYDVTYHTDAFARRTVPQRYDAANRHLILFGCSVTMGEGIDDTATLGAQLAQMIPAVNVYNYGVHGYGPQHMLARLQSGTLASEVESARGIALYVLLPVHVSRAIGDTRAFWVYTSPYYHLGDGDALLRSGSFVSGRPYTTAFYRSLVALKGHSWFLRIFDLNLPLWLEDADVDLTARILKESRAEYRRQFGGELYVVFHPTWALGDPGDRHLMELMRDRLRAAGVPMLDYSRTRGLEDVEKVNPACDQHPNGRLNAELATLLGRDLPFVR